MDLVKDCYILILLTICCFTWTSGSTQLPELFSMCPSSCKCLTTDEGLHRALCFDIKDLYKFSMRNKHHNINILDLSFSDIVKINGDLDRFTEIDTLDLSNNRLKVINRLLINSKKLVHLNLAKNQLTSFSADSIPSSVSSLDLRNNKLINVPSDLGKLRDLKHLQLEGNPLNCSCDNIKKLHFLQDHEVIIDQVLCASSGKKWNEIKTSLVCSLHKGDKKVHLEDVMLGDQPEGSTDDASTALTGDVIDFDKKDNEQDDDENVYLRVGNQKVTTVEPVPFENIEGSGDDNQASEISSSSGENNTELVDGSGDLDKLAFNMSSIKVESSTPQLEDDDDLDGSGDYVDYTSTSIAPFIITPFDSIVDNSSDSSMYVTISKIFQGNLDWNKDDDDKTPEETKDDKPVEEEITTDKVFVVDKGLSVDYNPETESESENYEESKRSNPKTSTGTYICIGLIIGLLVGLIGFTMIKSQIRKKRERRLIRQQRLDVEKAGKEMVDMNKSLLGKPVNGNDECVKKVNGNYELVPTHENKKPENGFSDKKNENGNGGLPDSKASDQPVIKITPLKSEDDIPHIDSNGYHEPDEYPHDYLPIIPPQDSGRVKIVLTETPKPKTPVLVTRSRSNAGDIIITPAVDQSPVHQNKT